MKIFAKSNSPSLNFLRWKQHQQEREGLYSALSDLEKKELNRNIELVSLEVFEEIRKIFSDFWFSKKISIEFNEDESAIFFSPIPTRICINPAMFAKEFLHEKKYISEISLKQSLLVKIAHEYGHFVQLSTFPTAIFRMEEKNMKQRKEDWADYFSGRILGELYPNMRESELQVLCRLYFYSGVKDRAYLPWWHIENRVLRAWANANRIKFGHGSQSMRKELFLAGYSSKKSLKDEVESLDLN